MRGVGPRDEVLLWGWGGTGATAFVFWSHECLGLEGASGYEISPFINVSSEISSIESPLYEGDGGSPTFVNKDVRDVVFRERLRVHLPLHIREDRVRSPPYRRPHDVYTPTPVYPTPV